MCFGPFKRVCHWGPLIALGIIKSVTFSTVACLSQWWPPQESIGGKLVFVAFALSAVLTLYFFLQATFTGPGALPRGWRPENATDVKYLQYCSTCEGYKAPRAHHCRKCGQCVLKMDHHCPWINNCVGHRNHGSFTLFLLHAVLGCAQATVILAICIYHAVHRTPEIHLDKKHNDIIRVVDEHLGKIIYIKGSEIAVLCLKLNDRRGETVDKDVDTAVTVSLSLHNVVINSFHMFIASASVHVSLCTLSKATAIGSSCANYEPTDSECIYGHMRLSQQHI
ncbi:palmitoyltransferase ZDHHC6-like [Penaeus chinensis]|uniref:palmitoyltransferase ZDHHC6-like n=1 Tax=Penaeus chinensis TaxID=139456 RepID=UPI001FB73164|nr:palmitoyltransferase ZDHHC6-like [Penaeus chinensis]